jgi:hypothetical protein
VIRRSAVLASGLLLLLLLLFARGVAAQERVQVQAQAESVPAVPFTPHIQDNSFLVEEAYNQDDGVVQHINQFARDRGTGDWVATFTQEWPVGGIRNQVSASFPLERIGQTGAQGLGDVALNYRYQLVGDGEARIAFAPRATVLLPSGSARRELGAGGPTGQISLPVSTVFSPSWVGHWNLGGTWTPSARNARGDRASVAAWNAGASVVFTGSAVGDAMIETVYSRFQNVAGSGRTSAEAFAFVSPGVRWAYDFPSGLQIVPGLAFPIGFGPSRGSRQVLLYLSFEHSFTRTDHRAAP